MKYDACPLESDYDGQSGPGTGFTPTTSVLPSQDQTINATYSYCTHVPLTPYELRNG